MLREYQEEIQKLKSMLEGKDGDMAGRRMFCSVSSWGCGGYKIQTNEGNLSTPVNE